MTKHSALMGVVDKLRRGERLSDEAINEIERLLRVLDGQGWSGFLPADRVAGAIVKNQRTGRIVHHDLEIAEDPRASSHESSPE